MGRYMGFSLFFKSLVFYISAALIAYALIPTAGISELMKFMAFAIGASFLTPFIYPHIRGVRKGDVVEVTFHGEEGYPGLLRIFLQRGSGVALEGGRIGDRIRVVMSDGSERRCRIVSYAGFMSPAKVRIEEGIRII